MEAAQCEFSEEILRLRRANLELERAVQAREASLAEVKERAEAEAKGLQLTVHNLLQQVDDITARKNSEADSLKQTVQGYIEKNRELEQALVREQRDHFFERAKLKASAGKRRAREQVKELRLAKEASRNVSDLTREREEEAIETHTGHSVDIRSHLSIGEDHRYGSGLQPNQPEGQTRTPHKLSYEEPSGGMRDASQQAVLQQQLEELVKLVEKQQHSIKVLEYEKGQVAAEVQSLQLIQKQTDRERYHLHSQLLTLEEEKMEILQHYENFKKVNSDLEEKVARLLRDKARLEVEVSGTSESKVAEQSETRRLRTELSEVNLRLNELQLEHNRLLSEHKESVIDFDSKNQRSKRYIGQLEAEFKVLTQTVGRLESELKETHELCRRLEGEKGMLKAEAERQADWREIQESNRVTELTKMVNELTNELTVQKEQTIRMTMSNLAEIADPKLFAQLGQEIQEKTGEENGLSLHSFDTPRHEGLQMIDLNYEEPLMDHISDRFERNSRASVLQKMKKGSADLTDHLDGLHLEVRSPVRNTGGLEQSQPLVTSDSIRKRYSQIAFSSEGKEKVGSNQRLSVAGMGAESQALAKLKQLGLTKDAKLSHTESDDDSSNAESRSDEEETDHTNKINELFEQLQQKNELVGQLQSELEHLKARVSSLETDLHLSKMREATSQQSLEMLEQLHVRTVQKSQKELDEMTQRFIESKIRANQFETERDIAQMHFGRTMKAKELELAIYRNKVDELEGKRSGRMTGLGRY